MARAAPPTLERRGLMAPSSTQQCGRWYRRLPTIDEEPLDGEVESLKSSEAAALLRQGPGERRKAVRWLLSIGPATIADSEEGSQIVQSAFESAVGEDRGAMVASFHGKVAKLAVSQHGSEVLAAVIRETPAQALAFTAAELAGIASTLAFDRYGARVLEAMMMHCSPVHLATLAQELLSDVAALIQHPEASCVLQHLFEYGDAVYNTFALDSILSALPRLAMQRPASQALQKLAAHVTSEERQKMINRILTAGAPTSFADVACSRCGCALLQELFFDVTEGDTRDASEVTKLLAKAWRPQLDKSKFGRKLVASIGLSSTLTCMKAQDAYGAPPQFVACQAA